MKYKKKEVFHYETQPKSLDRNHLDLQWVFGTFVKAETELFFSVWLPGDLFFAPTWETSTPVISITRNSVPVFSESLCYTCLSAVIHLLWHKLISPLSFSESVFVLLSHIVMKTSLVAPHFNWYQNIWWHSQQHPQLSFIALLSVVYWYNHLLLQGIILSLFFISVMGLLLLSCPFNYMCQALFREVCTFLVRVFNPATSISRHYASISGCTYNQDQWIWCEARQAHKTNAFLRLLCGWSSWSAALPTHWADFCWKSPMREIMLTMIVHPVHYMLLEY